MTHLGDKMKTLTQNMRRTLSTLESNTDAAIAKHAELDDRAQKAIESQKQLLADAEAGIAEVEGFLKGATNQ